VTDMNDLLKKLNTLIQAGIHDVLDEAQRVAGEPLKHIPSVKLGRDIQYEVEQLRERVNSSLRHEDELVGRIQEIEDDLKRLDRQADAAVEAGDDAKARYLLERMQRAQQRLEMTTSDLKAHRLATQELILRVNQLDAAVADAKRAEETDASDDVTPTDDDEVEIPVEVGKSGTTAETTSTEALKRIQEVNERAGKVLSDVLRDARQRINEMDALINERAGEMSETDTSAEVEAAIRDDAIEDDIAERRARLTQAPRKKPPTNDRT